MNIKYMQYLISPQTHLPLTDCGDFLATDNNSETYQIIKSVPVMLPKPTTAAWHRELIEVILWEYPDEIEKIFYELDHTKNLTMAALNETYTEHIRKCLHDKQGVIDAINKYAVSDTTKWIVKQQSDSAVSKEIMKTFKRLSTKHTGKVRVMSKKPGGEYYETYKALMDEALRNSPKAILELGTGAGGGTSAVALNMADDATLFTVDIGFDCLGNAIGIGKYLKKPDCVLPVCANFWYLPFAKDSFDTVFTFAGLDESRENERTISEVSRVLKAGGRFVCVAQKNSFMRGKSVLEAFGLNEAETIEMMKKCRLHSDIETLAECCKKYEMNLISSSEHTRNNNVFVTMLFEKN